MGCGHGSTAGWEAGIRTPIPWSREPLTGSRPLLSVSFHAVFLDVTSVVFRPFRCVLAQRVSLCLTPLGCPITWFAPHERLLDETRMTHAGEFLALRVSPFAPGSNENGIQCTNRIAHMLKPHNPIGHGIRFVEHRRQPVCRFQYYGPLTLLGEVESCRSAQGASDGLVPLR